MRSNSRLILPFLAAAGLAACGGEQMAEEPVVVEETAPAFEPYNPVPMPVLMRSTVTMAAFEYWGAVAVVVDAEGVHQNEPADDDEWEQVWAAGITLAESGNLMMLPPRAYQSEEWNRLARQFVDIGLEAARIAEAKDAEGVLNYGETILNACEECHQIFSPATPSI